jgi:hypothetical protein
MLFQPLLFADQPFTLLGPYQRSTWIWMFRIILWPRS